jgi:hypothetical protein
MGKIDSTLQYLLHLFLFDRLSKNCILDATDYNIGSQMNRLALTCKNKSVVELLGADKKMENVPYDDVFNTENVK